MHKKQTGLTPEEEEQIAAAVRSAVRRMNLRVIQEGDSLFIVLGDELDE